MHLVTVKQMEFLKNKLISCWKSSVLKILLYTLKNIKWVNFMVGKLYLNKADKRIWVFVRVRITHFHCSPKLLPVPSILSHPTTIREDRCLCGQKAADPKVLTLLRQMYKRRVLIPILNRMKSLHVFLADVVKRTIYSLKSQHSMRCQKSVRKEKIISCKQRLMLKNSNFRLNRKKIWN